MTLLILISCLLVQLGTSYQLTKSFQILYNARNIRNIGKLHAITISDDTATEVELAKDGGVKKFVVIPGTGKKIEAGDILAVEYAGYVAGSSKPFAKDDKAKFTFKDGTMIKGWDIAVGSMKIGEKSKFTCSSNYAYGDKGVGGVIPAGAKLEFEMKVLAWLGNQLRPETLFSKDLDIDPFIASTPESIQAEFNKMQSRKVDKYQGNIVDIYLRRLKNISFGFGGSNFFASQSGERPPWYLNPNITFPAMVLIVMAAFFTVFSAGGVKEKGGFNDIDVSSIVQSVENNLKV